ncbi:hypothetical protein PHSY_005252 [Pseudozyma hubeiensis SY62]|uniref:Uncharacterized protein n=1 Tax=Pseudozyma hubeiensis (strain SY62) TaxID=1305764 RepID=R9P8H0_PSEHS|nr:hypothetical protein PHSY_005252 [Pseudozyma hubeiensis SY62]GAC97666.1 hypothetical protein PHSY_005252 [Pseudozyma hubeiensis SY62]
MAFGTADMSTFEATVTATTQAVHLPSNLETSVVQSRSPFVRRGRSREIAEREILRIPRKCERPVRHSTFRGFSCVCRGGREEQHHAHLNLDTSMMESRASATHSHSWTSENNQKRGADWEPFANTGGYV